MARRTRIQRVALGKSDPIALAITDWGHRLLDLGEGCEQGAMKSWNALHDSCIQLAQSEYIELC